MSLFGTSGIRGSADDFFNNQFCFDIGRAFAIFLERNQEGGAIAIGMDPRESGQRIKESFTAGLCYEKREVLDQGITPVPAMNYILIADSTLAGSAMITGSHIRGDFNGIKFFAFRKEILKEHEKEIEEIYEQIKEKIPFQKDFIKLRVENRASGLYEERILKMAQSPYPKWKVVLDLGNGCQSEIMPRIFQKLGIETIVINNFLESDKFIARDTEIEEVMKELCEKVKQEKADFGIGFDADGDRMVLIDGKGRFIPGDYSGALVSKYSDASAVITPINTSQVVNHLGKKIIRTKVGSPFVVKAMEENNVSFGFEANGGGISKEVMLTRDAGSMTLKILNLLKENNKTLEELVAVLPRFYLFRTKVDCPTELNKVIMDKAKAEFSGVRIEEIDGLKIWQDDTTWILFRPSHNAPEFRVFAEAADKEKVDEIGRKGIAFVKSIVEKQEK